MEKVEDGDLSFAGAQLWSWHSGIVQWSLEEHGCRERRLLKHLQGWGHIPSLKSG